MESFRAIIRKNYYRIILAGCFLLSMTTTTIVYNCSGLFIKPLCDAMACSRTRATMYITIINIGSLSFSPFMGRILQRGNHRYIITVCSVVSGLALLGYSFYQRLWLFYLTSAVFGACASGLTTISISLLISRWFVKKRSLMLGIAFGGSSLGTAILSPATANIISNNGWRIGFRFLALVIVTVNIIVVLLFIRNKPSDMGLLPYGLQADTTEESCASSSVSREEAVKLPVFWLLSLSGFLSGMIGSGILQQLSAYLTDIGYSSYFASAVISGSMVVAAIGKPVSGVIFDRWGAVAGVRTLYIAAAAAAALLLVIDLPLVPQLFVAVFGLSYCIMSIPTSIITLSLFGPKEYGSIFGVVTMFLSMGIAMGSPASAVIYDLTGSYRPAWFLYCLFSLTALCILSRMLHSKKLTR